MGRDHTIYAREKGYVVYYKDVWKGLGYGGAGRIRKEGNKGSGGEHYKRFIGIVFEKGDTLPWPTGKPRKRRLGMVARPRVDFPAAGDEAVDGREGDVEGLTEAGSTVTSLSKEERSQKPPTWSKGYQIRESNASIGRILDTAGKGIRKFKRGDRWLAWRKRAKRVEKSQEAKRQKKSRKGKGAERAAMSGDLRKP